MLSWLSHISSIIAVLAVLVILVINIWLHNKTKITPFIWYSGAWAFAFVVRFYIMLADLAPTTFYFNNQVTILNALMAIAYVLLVIGTIMKVKAIYTIIRNGVNKVLKGK